MFFPIDTFWKPCSGWPAPSLTLNGGRRDRLTFKAVGLSAQGCDGNGRPAMHGCMGWVNGMGCGRWISLAISEGRKRPQRSSLNAHASASANANVNVRKVWVS